MNIFIERKKRERNQCGDGERERERKGEREKERERERERERSKRDQIVHKVEGAGNGKRGKIDKIGKKQNIFLFQFTFCVFLLFFSSLCSSFLMMVSQQFTVGKLDAGLAILLSPDHHVVEFPSTILPVRSTF